MHPLVCCVCLSGESSSKGLFPCLVRIYRPGPVLLTKGVDLSLSRLNSMRRESETPKQKHRSNIPPPSSDLSQEPETSPFSGSPTLVEQGSTDCCRAGVCGRGELIGRRRAGVNLLKRGGGFLYC